jgi:hypothetical protein
MIRISTFNIFVTNRSVNVEITERIENVGQFYRIVRDILWKSEMSDKGKYMPI